jgi:alpha-mannosidase
VVERHHQELARFDLDAANLEVALAMAADGRINGMVVSDVHMHAGEEPGVLDVDITVSDSGEPDDVLLQSLADAARRMVATGSVRLFRLRGLRPEEVTFRFLAADVPGPGYRSYVLAAEGTEMPLAADQAFAPPIPPAAAPAEGGPPRSAAIFQPDPHEEILPEVIAESEPYPGVPTVGAMDPTEGYLIENDFYTVEASARTGWLTITDKQTGLVIRGGNRFVDAGDCGDEYTYCPPAEDQVITGFSAPPRIDMHYTPLGSSLVIEGTLLLPAWLSEDRRGRSAAQVTCPVRSTIRLLHGVRRVDISTTVDNQAGDHWLRVLFDVPVQTEVSEAEGTFDVLTRPLDLPEADSSWREQPVPTHPQKTWVAVGDGQRGVLLANRGLPEYEVLRQPDGAGVTLALTLLRCVGWQSRDDLTTRQGHAGPGLPTPGAQCLGLTRFDYALVPFAGTWQTSRAYRQAHSFNVPLRALADDFHPGPLPPTDTLVIIEPDELVVSALKRSADGEAVILRAWNISDAPVQARIVPPPFLRAARLVRLDETPAAETGRVQSIPDAPGWRLDLRPREICTLRLEV